MIRTAVWQNIQDSCFRRYICKTTATSNFCRNFIYMCVCDFGVNCSIKSGWEGTLLLLSFLSLSPFYTESTLNTETKSSEIFNYTKKPNHPDHINQTRNCANPRLLCRQIQDAVVPKETSKFSKRSSMIFCRFSRKKSLGSVLFSRDFFGLIKMC